MPDAQGGQATLSFGSPARGVKVRKKGDGRNLPPFRFWMIAGLMTLGVILSVILLFRAERLLIRDERFVLAGPPDPGQELPDFKVRGLHNASRERLLQVFDRDFGRSIYLLPIAERRESLLRIDWVRDASIYRIWPNRIEIEVAERSPVAFAQLPALTTDGNYTSSYSLIDAEGVLLTPPRQGDYHLPVLTGLRLRDTQATRRERVRQMQRLLSDVGPAGQKLSEIDAGDLHNLKATIDWEGHPIVLVMGDQNFKVRLQNFLENFGRISKDAPGATALDLRLEDRITVVESRQTARR